MNPNILPSSEGMLLPAEHQIMFDAMRSAMAAKRDFTLADKPRKEHNRLVAIKNQAIKDASEKANPMLYPLRKPKLRLPGIHATTLAANSVTMDALKELPPSEWLRRIETLETRKLRRAVACVVWWDFFSSRISTERWADLDGYLKGSSLSLPLPLMCAGLIAVGYTPWNAILRLNDMGGDDENNNQN